MCGDHIVRLEIIVAYREAILLNLLHFCTCVYEPLFFNSQVFIGSIADILLAIAC